MNNYNTDDIIYALATAWNKSALAVIRISGNGCVKELAPFFKCKSGLEKVSSNSVVFGHLRDKDNKALDECMISVFKDGHGFTGEEAMEISCHGGLETIKSILAHLQSIGMRQAKRGEFTLRAFLHNKMDLTRAEAVNELINSRGKTGQTLALTRLNGALYKKISEIKDIVTDIMSTVEVQLDYAEDEISEDLDFPVKKLQQAVQMINTIGSTYNTGKLYSQGAKLVLAGPSNAGKSSLFNLFLKEERAIVSDIKGTTRDYIEAECSIDGIPVRLFDTAGFRESNDILEEEGIRRSQSLLEDADIVVYLVDATEPQIDESIVSDSRCIPVINKIDAAQMHRNGFVELSVATGDGFDSLCKAISAKLKSDIEITDDSSLVIENERQKENLERASKALNDANEHVKLELPLDIVTLDIQEALEALGEITGEVTTDDILDRIFANFCVGK